MSVLPAYCSAKTLAKNLDLSEATVWAMVKRGDLPKPVYLGTNARWKWRAVEEWIDHAGALAEIAGPKDEIMEMIDGR